MCTVFAEISIIFMAPAKTMSGKGTMQFDVQYYRQYTVLAARVGEASYCKMSHDEPMASRARGAAAASVDKVSQKY